MVVAIAAIALVAFIGGQYFITHHKKEESEVIQGNKVIYDNLPPKPEERWRYIKELENRRPDMYISTKSSANSKMKHPSKSMDEQHQFKAQIQNDMRQHSTQLNKIHRNKQISERNQRQKQIQQQWTQNQPVQLQSKMQSHKELLRIPACTATQQSTMQIDTTKTKEINESKLTARKKDKCYWMVQCGSFKNINQAETVRAQLTLEGFDSHITTNNDWNRVVIGPMKSKDNADGTINHLKMAGHTNCVLLVSGGG